MIKNIRGAYNISIDSKNKTLILKSNDKVFEAHFLAQAIVPKIGVDNSQDSNWSCDINIKNIRIVKTDYPSFGITHTIKIEGFDGCDRILKLYDDKVLYDVDDYVVLKRVKV